MGPAACAVLLGTLLAVATAAAAAPPLPYELAALAQPRRSILAAAKAGVAPRWRLSFTATAPEPFELTQEILAAATAAIKSVAQKAGITPDAPPTFTATAQRLYVKLLASQQDKAAARKLAGVIKSSPPAGLLGAAAALARATYSDVSVTWICATGQTLCGGQCVDAGSSVVTVQGQGGRYLSAAADNSTGLTAVGTAGGDGGGGRQRWTLSPSGVGPDSYTVRASGGASLGADASGRLGMLATSDRGGSGCLLWQVKLAASTSTSTTSPQQQRLFSIACEQGLTDPSKSVLTFDKQGVAMLWTELHRAALRDAAQRFVVHAVAPTAPVTVAGQPSTAQAAASAGAGAAAQASADASASKGTSAATKGSAAAKADVFVGGAWKQSMTDMARQPNTWRTVAGYAGYWLHPMSLVPLRQQGLLRPLLSHFGVKRFVYEMNLFDATDPKTKALAGATAPADLVRAAGGGACAFYAPWVPGNRLAQQLDEVVSRYVALRKRMAAGGYDTGYFFYAPPAPETLANADALLNHTRTGYSPVEFVVRTAGLRGIALDFPASLLLSPSFPAKFGPKAADKSRALAKQAHDVARKLGIRFCWVFNGYDVSVQAAMDAITKMGMRVDCWVVDNFAAVGRRGTPETDPSSVSGQALNVLKWVHSGGAMPASSPAPATSTTTCEPFAAFSTK
eukprot:scaffold19.g1788.t1